MANTASKGNCYLCGKALTKTGAKRHVLTHEYIGRQSQTCRLIKIEATYNKDYWLYVDIPFTSRLESLDSFLRDIWLECCGHMSAFYIGRYDEISMDTKISRIADGTVMNYEYDFGSSTKLTVTFVGTISRKWQKDEVRLLIRNEVPDYRCSVCGKPADYIFVYEAGYPFFCETCAEKHFEGFYESCLPVVNSPRMGVCGYEGERDVYGFDPQKINND